VRGERLQKLLARSGVASRRKVEELIAGGRVTVNGKVAAVGDRADPERDAVKVDGKRIQFSPPHLYLLLNKPDGFISTRSDPEGRPTVFDLVPPQRRKALVAVGRLDYHSEGLLLLTDDGELAQRVSHPRYGCRKTYAVKVKGVPGEEDLARFRRGVVLDGRRTAPAEIRPRKLPTRAQQEQGVGNSWWTVELGEGRTRQIREMFFRLGHPVQKLRRLAIGPVADADLPSGAFRKLTAAEVAALKGEGRGGWPPGRRPGKGRDRRRRRGTRPN
jgi:23S rRNA pseudouridine2605 synthase